MTGEPPYQRDLGLALINAHLSQPAPSIVAKRPELPGSVDQVLAKAMAKSPANRYATCTEFATDLGKAIGMVSGSPSVVGGAMPAAGAGDQPVAHPATQLAAGLVTSPDAPAPGTNQAVPPAAAAAGGIGAAGAAAAGVGAAAGTGQPPVTGQPQWQDFATQYAGQTPPPQQVPQGQTPPPQNQPAQGWQGGPVGYPPYQQGQQQPYQTGPIPPYQTGPIQPVTGYPQYQGQPVGPTAQGVWQPPPQPPQPKKSRGVLIGAVAATLVVAVAVVAVVYFVLLKKNPGPANPSVTITTTVPGSPSTNPTSPISNPTSQQPAAGPTEQSEATSMSNLLMTSAQTRSQWNGNALVTNVGNCGNLSEDITQLGDIANSRSSELNQAENLQVDKIPNGANLKSELMSALQVSYTIDNDYLSWAHQQSDSGCTTGTNSTYYQNATAEDNTATNDKQAFLNDWDPIASQFGLEQFGAGQI